MSLTRRAMLGAIAAAALAGCRPRRSPHPSLPSADRAAVGAALDVERALLAMYDVAIAQLDAVAAGPLSRARDRHAEHLRALTRFHRPTSASVSPAPATAPADRSALAASLTAGAAALRDAAVRVHTGHLAALLASVAAEHAADASQMPETQMPETQTPPTQTPAAR